MIYMGFLILCVVCVAVATLLLDVRKQALMVGCLGLCLAYFVEVNGVQNDDWSYASVHSVLRVSSVPVEILAGYFTAAFFLVIVTAYLPRVSTHERRKEIVEYLLLGIGVICLAQSYLHHSISVLVGWSLLGMYGMSVSRDRTVPLAVGMGAFLADWAVESMLTAWTEYYSSGWNATIGLVFMFAGMFISGILTHASLVVDAMPLDLAREEPS